MLRNPIARCGWLAIVVLDLLWHYWRHVSLPLLRGEVVIADRYVSDAEAELSAYLGRDGVRQTLAGRILSILTPRPQGRFLLDLPVDIAFERMGKGRESLEYLEQLRQIHLNQSRRCGAYVLDASRSLDEVSDELVYEVLSDYFARYHTFLNALFLANPQRSRGRSGVYGGAK